jgi:hypothetical protein
MLALKAEVSCWLLLVVVAVRRSRDYLERINPANVRSCSKSLFNGCCGPFHCLSEL